MSLPTAEVECVGHILEDLHIDLDCQLCPSFAGIWGSYQSQQNNETLGQRSTNRIDKAKLPMNTNMKLNSQSSTIYRNIVVRLEPTASNS